MTKKDWIIGIGGTEVDDVIVYKFTGTVTQAKEMILKLIKEDINEDRDVYDSGTDELEDITVSSNGRIYGWACFSDYHIDYSATPMSEIQEIKYETTTCYDKYGNEYVRR